MQFSLLVLTAATLLTSCVSSNVNRHSTRIAQDIDNSIQRNALPTKLKRVRKFVTLVRQPAPRAPQRVGEPLELTCEALGAPAPVVRWYRDHEPVYDHDIESNEITGSSNPASLGRVVSTLLVSQTQGEHVYTCHVTAGLMTTQASTIVHSTDGETDFSERSRLHPLAPLIVGYYTVYMDAIGSTVVLPCQAKGHPRPRVSWINDSKEKDIGAMKDPRFKVLRSGALVISSLRWSDMGSYSCKVTNHFGSHNITSFVYPAKVSANNS